MIDIKKCEKYAEKIVDAMVENNCNFIEKYVLKPQCLECRNLICSDCIKIVKQWMLEEYVEPEIDWLKVPVNTPVLVSDSLEDKQAWKKKYFCCYLPNSINPYLCFWGDNSQIEADTTVKWKYCKLAEGVDPTPFLKEV